MSTAAAKASPRTQRAFSASGDHVTPVRNGLSGHMTSMPVSTEEHPNDPVTPETANGKSDDIITIDFRRDLSLGDASDEEESTAGEGDTVPYESTTTTDTIPEPVEPLDFIESDPRCFSSSVLSSHNGHFAAGSGVVARVGGGGGGVRPHSHIGMVGHRYENWNVLMQEREGEDGLRSSSSRGRVMRRFKASRISLKDKQRAPYPLPRHVKTKAQHFRPSPTSRKRRLSGRAPPRPPDWNASEGDMAQADEMGEGEVKDDGFVDCPPGPEGNRRRNKKRPGGIHMLLPTVGTSSPPSSPSNTPVSRRRTSSRKSRPKPRPRKPSIKHPTLASADISTQETTTPGPGSSDTTDESGSPEETQPIAEEASAATSDLDYDDIASPTSVDIASSGDKAVDQPQNGMVVDYKSARFDSIPLQSGGNRYPMSEGSPGVARKDQESRTPNQSKLVFTSLHSNSEENLRHDSNETSDTDLTSLSHPTSPPRQARFTSPKVWSNRRFESDFSTAPFSSETSDMDTSGNERGGPLDPSDRVLPFNFTPTARASKIVSSNSDAPISKLDSRLHAEIKPSKGARKECTGKAVCRPPVSRKPAALVNGTVKSSPSPPIAKRPLQSSTSSPTAQSTITTRTANHSPTLNPKGAAPPRPKPPLAAKPPKREVKPKPSNLPNGSNGADSVDVGLQKQEVSQPECHHSNKPAVRSEANHRRGKSYTDGDSTRYGSPSQIRKVHSDTELGSLPHRKVPPRSPSAAVRKMAKLYEEKEPDEEPAPVKPAVASKPRRQPSDKRVHTTKPVASVVSNVTAPSTEMTSGTASDSSKPPSSSETPPSHSQSPSVSPFPSPATRKKPQVPQKPAVLPKKPRLVHQGVSAASVLNSKREAEESPRGGKIKSDEGLTKPQPLPRSTNGGTISPSAAKEEEAPVLRRNKPATPSPTPTASVSSDSEQAPPVPPRKGNRRSTHIELIIPISDEQNTFYPPAPPEEEVLPPSLLSSRRQPPSPPPSVRHVPSDGKTITIARSSNVGGSQPPTTAESQGGPKRHSMFSMNISPKQARRISHNYEVCEQTLDLTDPQETPSSNAHPKPPQFRIKSQNTCALGARSKSPDSKSSMSKTPDSAVYESRSSGVGSLANSRKDSDSDVELSSSYSPTGRRYTTGSMSKRNKGPPKPPKYTSPSDDSGTATSTDRTTPPLLRRPTDTLPPIPPAARDNTPPPLPSQPIPRKKDRVGSTRRKQLSPTVSQQRAGSPFYSKGRRRSSSESPEPLYEFIKSGQMVDPSDVRLQFHENEAAVKQSSKSSSGSSVAKLFKRLSGSTDDFERVSVSSPESPVPIHPRDATSFSSTHSTSSAASSLMYRRATSDRYKHKVSTLDSLAVNGIDMKSLHRTPSLDKLDARMIRSTRNSMRIVDESSSDSDDEPVVISPTQQGLPETPSASALYRSPVRSSRDVRLQKSISVFVTPDEEPLYQYINTAEFLNVPRVHVRTHGPSRNQLEIARQFSSRRLWCELPEVIASGVLDTLQEEEKKLQEAMFEVISSEATYLRSLDVLIEHFMEDPGMNPHLPEGRRVLDKRQHHVIFSNVLEVRNVSARFLEELQKRQRESAVVKNISDIILDYAENRFDCYVRYCTNQIYQTRELQDCLENNIMFREYLKRLESHKKCQNLSMQSFLLLPMQRITRMPLLILAILNRTPLKHPDHATVEKTLRTVQKLVTSCNDGARKMERTEQLHSIHQKLDFRKLKPFPLVSVSRQLERKGTLFRLRVEQKLFNKHHIKKKPVYIFVFTDYIIITKRKKDPKGDYTYKVVDYASRAVIEVEDLESHPGVTFPKHTFGEQDTVAMATWAVSTANVKHAFLVILLDNARHQSEKYIFVAQNNTDKTRWMESITRPDIQKEEEKIYQHWDCPQVQAIYDYQALQPDELGLERGDVIKVYRKMADGWYEGERLRDLRWGWFPSNFTVEIENEHTRARNLRETHKLLSLPFNPEEFSARLQNMT